MFENTLYTIDITSNYFSFTNNIFPLKFYDRVFFSDSLFTFYPYAEIFVKDTSGTIIGSVSFIEGIDFLIKFGCEKKKFKKDNKDNYEYGGYIEHNFVWSETQFKREWYGETLNGIPMLYLLSAYSKKDFRITETYNVDDSEKKTVSNVVNDIIKKKFAGIKKTYITETVGTPVLCQYNMTYKDFLKTLVQYAYSQSQDTEGFFTFINLQNEFYFTTLKDLFFSQQPVKTFKMQLKTDMMLDDEILIDYHFHFGGMPVNKYNYLLSHTYYNSQAQVKNETLKIYNITKPYGAKQKFTITNENMPDTHSEEVYYGIIQDKENEQYIYKAKRNYMYRDSLLSHRILCTVLFDPQLVSGKLVTLEMQKVTNKDILPSPEYSGNWLIIESQHYTNEFGVAYTQLTLARPTLQVDDKNPYVSKLQ